MNRLQSTAPALKRTFFAVGVRARGSALLIVFVLGVLPLQGGCYHYRVVAPAPDPATDYERRTVHSLFWGLVQQDVPAADCVSNAMDEVRVTTNLGYLVLSVVTLGIWVPLEVQWRCAKLPPQEGEI